jgi:hypothetical protein
MRQETPSSGKIPDVLSSHFEDHDHGGQDAAFKNMIGEHIANIPLPEKSKTPDSPSPHKQKRSRVHVEGSGELNQDSPEWNRLELGECAKKVGPVKTQLNLDDEGGAMQPGKKVRKLGDKKG